MTRNNTFHNDRRENRDNLSQSKVEPYPRSYEHPTVSLTEFRELYGSEEVFEQSVSERLSGRVIRINNLGSLAFIEIRDSMDTCQLMLRSDQVNNFESVSNTDLGDIISAEGVPTRTNTGELTLDVDEWQMLTKALRHPPWAASDSGFTRQNEIEQRAGALQLQELNQNMRIRFNLRRQLIRQLEQNRFIEVTTPILHRTPGGAEATSFETRSEALDDELYLRVAPELYLKRLLVGDFERVFEVAKSFRNEDIDSTHNPEFEMVEIYQAYADYEDMMGLTESIIGSTIRDVTGSQTVTINDNDIDFTSPWNRIDYLEAIESHTGINIEDINITELVSVAGECGDLPDNPSRIDCYELLYETYVEPEITEPTFVTHHPIESVPLCEPLPDDDSVAQRFELIVSGVELANGYTELRDPEEQAERFQEQAQRTGGEVNQEYVSDLAYGMPPSAGLGIGIDRLAMIATGTESIKDVIPFPQTSL